MLRVASRRVSGVLGSSNVSSIDCTRALDAFTKATTCSDGMNLSFLRFCELKRPYAAQPAYSSDEEQDLSMAGNKIQPHPSHVPTPHPGSTGHHVNEYMLQGPTYTKEYLESVVPQHRKPKAFHDWTGLYGVRLLRSTFDLITGYGPNMNEKKWLNRFVFLETVAGVPGMVGAGLRHMRSLRTMKRDKGWIHTLLEEAENERMHLLTFMELSNPGMFFRGAVLGAQGIFTTLYTIAYAISPRHCHAFVSYLEEEAVKTYTHAIADVDSGKLPSWINKPAPEIAVSYWRLGEGATMRDLLLAVRADEACHKHVNAVFAELKTDQPNPFNPGPGTTTMV